VKLFIDECLSPRLAARLNASGEHDAMHPRDNGRLGERDDQVLLLCLQESRTIVTENAVDFRKLVAAEEIHPGRPQPPQTHAAGLNSYYHYRRYRKTVMPRSRASRT
jgi:hypothetical protein